MADWMASWPRSVKRSKRMIRYRPNVERGTTIRSQKTEFGSQKERAFIPTPDFRLLTPRSSSRVHPSDFGLAIGGFRLRLAAGLARLFGLRLDGALRVRVGALAADLDAARLHFLALLEHDAEHAVLVLGGRVLGRHGLREREGAGEAAVGALDAVVVVRLFLLLEAALAAQRQHVVLDRQLEVFAVHAGQFGFEHDLVFVLVDVHARRPGAAREALLAER